MERLRVGYLHIGKHGGGVRRYGAIVAEAAAESPELDVIEADAGERGASPAAVREAAGALAGCDVVHLQWKPADWGGGLAAWRRLRLFVGSVGRPIVVTLHDVWERRGIRERWLDPEAWMLRWVGRRAARVVVHGEEERRRLTGLVPRRRVEVVPHFVERRTVADAEAARAALGLAGKHVVTILGFMVRRKGYRLMVESLPLLPTDVVALFAGGPMPGREARAEELRARARELGVGDRLVITGYVDAERLDQALAATHLAACPFSDLSASGSLSTWISTGRPILASDLPQFREYDLLVPGALRRFSPRTPEAFAAAVRECLEDGPPPRDPLVVALAERLAPDRIASEYRTVYEAVR